MPKTEKFDLIRYEYIVYIYLLDTHNICGILLTKDDFVDMKSDSGQIVWVPVESMDVNIVETAEEVGEKGGGSVSRIKHRICGLFEAEPLDWKYAKITIGDNVGTKQNVAMARMPRSPIVPVIFDINK